MIQLFYPVFNEENAIENIRDCLSRGWTGYGEKSTLFEEKWKNYLGFEYALFLNSATAGLDLTFQCLKDMYGWSKECEIITTPLTFISTNHAILKAGLTPIFADINDTLCLDPVSVKNRITARTKAVIFVGIGGNCGDWDQIVELCRKEGLILIVDGAHMSGTKWNSQIAGKEADVYISSFQSTKVLQTADSGMVCCNDKELMNRMQKMAWCGIDKTRAPFPKKKEQFWYYDIVSMGGSYLGNDIMASLALAQFETLEMDIEKRHEILNRYTELLEGYSEIGLVRVSEKCHSAQWLFQVIVEKRDELMEYLYNEGIYTGLHYLDNTEYRQYQYAKNTCPMASYYSSRVVSLPMHLRLLDLDIQHICEMVIRFVREELK